MAGESARFQDDYVANTITLYRRAFEYARARERAVSGGVDRRRAPGPDRLLDG
ncbi:MAG TPA: hypothetical protein VLA09_05900 [Longimicrobiales bacterium]|nr:hypothetical protein [Longimicrobiales bacterium]